MNLRIAKKVLRDRERYSGYQHLAAANRLIQRASLYEDAHAILAAFRLKPENAFQNDERFELKFELLIGQDGREESLTYSRKPIVIPEVICVPAFRRDGQVQNFNALPQPGIKKSAQVSLARYQVRDQNRRAKPKRSVADFA